MSYFFFMIKFFLFLICCLLLSIMLPFILVFFRNGTGNKAYARLMHYLFKTAIFMKIVYIDLEKFDTSKSYIYICNHQSFLDAIAMGLLFPNNCYILVKESLKYTPYFGFLYYLSGNFYINRSHSEKAKQTLKKIIQKLRTNKSSLFILPQGTRCKDNKVTKLKRGFIELAKETELDIFPFVFSTYKLWDVMCHFKNKKPIYVKICEPIDYRKPEPDILEEVKNLMNNKIQELDALS